MSTGKRPQFLARMSAVAVTVATAGLAFTGVASADTPPVTPSIGGDDIWPVENLEACGGPIHLDRETDRERPGNLEIIATPRGAFGASSQCATTIQIDWINGIAPFVHTTWAQLDRAGATRIDIPAGAGVSLVTVSVVPQRALAVSNYVWIAP